MPELVLLAARLPWWLSLGLALASYFLLHALAAPAPLPTGPVRAGHGASGAVVRGVATVLQFVVPLMFVAASLLSFLRASKRPAGIEGAAQPAQHGARERDGIGRVEPRLGPERPSAWSIGVLQRMDWKHLELVAAAYYEKLGFRAVTQAVGADGGIDIRLYRGEGPEPFAIVQCKSRSSQPVGVAHARELLGVMTHAKVRTGVLLCTSGFTREAETFAASNRITLVHGSALLAKIQALPAEAQAELLSIATAGDWTTPTCASCGTKMLLRQSQRGPFWGCAAYPRCKSTLQLSREQRAGA